LVAKGEPAVRDAQILEYPARLGANILSVIDGNTGFDQDVDAAGLERFEDYVQIRADVIRIRPCFRTAYLA
jgi:hypothetical protein